MYLLSLLITQLTHVSLFIFYMTTPLPYPRKQKTRNYLRKNNFGLVYCVPHMFCILSKKLLRLNRHHEFIPMTLHALDLIIT